MSVQLNSPYMPKWLMATDASATASFPIPIDPKEIRIVSQSATNVTIILPGAGHAGTLPVITAAKDLTISLTCASGNAGTIITGLSRLIGAQGTVENTGSEDNVRLITLVGTASAMTEQPAATGGLITAIVIDFDASS